MEDSLQDRYFVAAHKDCPLLHSFSMRYFILQYQSAIELDIRQLYRILRGS